MLLLRFSLYVYLQVKRKAYFPEWKEDHLWCNVVNSNSLAAQFIILTFYYYFIIIVSYSLLFYYYTFSLYLIISLLLLNITFYHQFILEFYYFIITVPTNMVYCLACHFRGYIPSPLFYPILFRVVLSFYIIIPFIPST